MDMMLYSSDLKMQKPQRVNKPMTGHFAKKPASLRRSTWLSSDSEDGEAYEIGQADHSC